MGEVVTPQVFTAEFIRGLPPDSWLLQVATIDQFKEVREHIEGFIDLMGEQKAKAIRLFQNPDMPKFWDAYKELMVGAILLECGISAQNSPRVMRGDGTSQTPDWVVFGEDGRPTLIVEVTPLHGNQDGETLRSQVEDLRNRLKEGLPPGFDLELSDYLAPEVDDLAVAHSSLVEALTIALGPTAPPDRLEHRMNLEEIAPDLGFSGVVTWKCREAEGPSLIQPYIFVGDAGGYDMDRFKSSVAKKARKYEVICSELNCPLVVAICPEFWANIFPSTVDYFLARCGFFERVSNSLSSIWICDCGASWSWRSHLVHNPKAIRPTPNTVHDKW